MTVNEKIKAYLANNGIKQAFLAEKTGINFKIISEIVNSKRKISAEEIGKISKALNVSTDIFFED